MGTVTATALGPRSRSTLVFWSLIALVVSIALGSLLLRQETDSQAHAELPVTMLETTWSSDADGQKSTASSLMGLPAEAAQPLLRDDLAAAAPPESLARQSAGGVVDDALIVRTGSLELEVPDVASSLGKARRQIAALGGYVAGSDEYDQGESRWATVTYRVPVEQFSEAIDALRGISDRVVRESTQSAEVTATIMDLDARIANLRASEAALVAIMDRAGRIDDVLSVQTRLEDVRGRIEQLDAQRTNLADQAALSTLTVSWLTPVAAVTMVQEGWDVGSEIDRALAQTVEAVQGLGSLAIWFAVVVLPLVVLPLLLLVVLVVLLRRRTHAVAPATHATD